MIVKCGVPSLHGVSHYQRERLTQIFLAQSDIRSAGADIFAVHSYRCANIGIGQSEVFLKD